MSGVRKTGDLRRTPAGTARAIGGGVASSRSITLFDSARYRHGGLYLPHKYLELLRRAWQERRLVLMLGAGISQPYGLPNWDALVLDILSHAGHQIRIDKADSRKVTSWVVKRLDLSLPVLARIARVSVMKQLREEGKPATQRAFATYLRDLLYRTFRIPRPERLTSMFQVVTMIDRSEREGRRIPFVLTFNFDDVLEMRLRAFRVATHPIFSLKQPVTHALPIYHLHGYLPREGRVPPMELVFSEEQYHHVAQSSLHWASVKLFEALTENTCLMIGLSLSDPNIRRLLDAIPRRSKTPQHFLVRQMPTVTVQEARDAIAAIKERAAGRISDSGPRPKSGSHLLISSRDPRNFGEVLGLMMRYENQSLRDMGVVPLWIKSFDDLPGLLGPIATAD
jgi:hypothetical protein